MQLPPVEVLLSWPAPNYVDPTDIRGPQLLWITFILFPIALIAVILRTFTRLCISKSFGVDDLFLLIAILPTTGCVVVTALAMQDWGWNRHVWDVPFNLITLGLKFTIVAECLFAVAVSCTKLSMLILTRRVMSNGTGILRHIAAAVMIVVGCEAIIFCLVVIFTCRPVSAYWTLSIKPQKCINERLHLVIGGTINTLTDFFVVFLPLPTVFKLKVHRRQRIILYGLFSAGFVVCVAGVARIVYSWKETSSYDRTWESYGLWVSSITELYLGVFCTSVPACKPFFSRYLPSFLGSSLGSSKKPSEDSSFALKLDASKQSMPSTSYITQEKRFSQSSEHNAAFELQRVPISKFCTSINGTQFLPLRSFENLGSTPEQHVDGESSMRALTGGIPSTSSPLWIADTFDNRTWKDSSAP